MSRPSIRTLLGVALFTLPACAPMATLQPPQTVKPGEGYWAFSSSVPTYFFFEDENFLHALSVGLRTGIGERTDVGIRFGILDGLSVEAKHEIVQQPVTVSGLLGTSLLLDPWGEGGTHLGIHPGIIAGTERVYGAARVLTYPTVENPDAMLALSVGAVLGTSVRILPEVAYYPSFDGEPLWVFGLSLQRRWPAVASRAP